MTTYALTEDDVEAALTERGYQVLACSEDEDGGVIHATVELAAQRRIVHVYMSGSRDPEEWEYSRSDEFCDTCDVA